MRTKIDQSSGFVLTNEDTRSPSFQTPRLRRSSILSNLFKTFLFLVSPPGGLKLGCLLIKKLLCKTINKSKLQTRIEQNHAGKPAGSEPGLIPVSSSFSFSPVFSSCSECSSLSG